MNKDHPYFCRLQSILQSFSLSQVVHSPTHINSNGHASLIDLALVSSKTQLLDCSVIPPLANADHNGLELFFKWKHCDKQVRVTPRTIWRYKDADYRKACQMIDETNWDDLLHMKMILTALPPTGTTGSWKSCLLAFHNSP